MYDEKATGKKFLLQEETSCLRRLELVLSVMVI